MKRNECSELHYHVIAEQEDCDFVLKEVAITECVPRTAFLHVCPVCLRPAGDAQELFRSNDLTHEVPGHYGYFRCESCRSVYQNPMVIDADLELCYPGDYYAHARITNAEVRGESKVARDRGFAALRDWLRLAVRKRIRTMEAGIIQRVVGGVLARSRSFRERAFFGLTDELIPHHQTHLRALDIGCGAGFQLRELANAGWLAEGVEWDEEACNTARQTSGCRITRGDFRQVALPCNAFDLILMNHVFEHLSDPLSALKRTKQLLHPGGKVVLIYPNPESLAARTFQNLWYGWEAPRHLVFASVRALPLLAQQAGLQVLGIRTTARFAAWFYAGSRMIQQTGRVCLSTLNETGSDRKVACLEALLIAAGASVGEEIVAQFVRPAL